MGRKKRRKIRMPIKRTPSPETSTSLTKITVPETAYEKASTNVRKLIDYWNALPETRNILIGTNTKTLRRVVAELQKHMRSSSVKEVEFTMALYNRLIQKGVIPKQQVTNLHGFLLGNKYGNIVAWYFVLQNKKNREELYKTAKYKKLIKKLKISYCTHILNVFRMPKWTAHEEKQFEAAAWNLVRFIRKNQHSKFIVNMTDDDFIRILLSALQWTFKNQRIVPGHLSSRYTFEKVLPQYLHTTRQRYF